MARFSFYSLEATMNSKFGKVQTQSEHTQSLSAGDAVSLVPWGSGKVKLGAGGR